MAIRCIITGGTIDKQYNWQDGNLIFTESVVPKLFERGRMTTEMVYETVFLKDSLDHTDEDKQQILERCKASAEDKIIITHGTDTMAQTAEQLSKQIDDKTIVLMGAMIPYSITNSDALFNLGAASIAAQHLPHGVYVVMNGQVFKANQVTKNRELGVFEAI